MSKDYTVSGIIDEGFRIITNYYDSYENKYYKFRVECYGDGTNGNGVMVKGKEFQNFGTGRDTKFTNVEIYTTLNSQCQPLATLYKNLYLNLINEDISA